MTNSHHTLNASPRYFVKYRTPLDTLTHSSNSLWFLSHPVEKYIGYR